MLTPTLSEILRVKRDSGKLKRIVLSRPQQQDWEILRTAMLQTNPAFTEVFYRMLVPENAQAKQDLAFFTDQVPRAATDAFEIFLNPTWFFDKKIMNVNRQIFTVTHEIMHPTLHHNGQMQVCRQRGTVILPSGKVLKYYPGLANRAMDYVINDLLIRAKIGEPPDDICWDTRIGTADDSWIDVYAKLYQEEGPNDGPHEGNLGGDVLEPGSGQPADVAAKPRSEQEWQVAVSGAMETAKAQGKLPQALEAKFGEVLEPKVTWTEHIEAFFARKVGSGSYDWVNPDPEFIVRGHGALKDYQAIFAPGRSGHTAGTIVVGMDTSGSIYADPTLIDRWMGELSGILQDINPKRLIVIWCDDEVHRVDEVEEASDLDVIRSKGAVGGGGTDFRPVFDHIKEHGLEPDAVVYLTDGFGDFPRKEPAYPVLWGNISKGQERLYPWGTVVTVPVQ